MGMSDYVLSIEETTHKRIESLESVLHEVLEYFENRSDIVDGPEGTQLPNKEMQLASEIKQVLEP